MPALPTPVLPKRIPHGPHPPTASAHVSPLQRWHRLSADRDIVFDCSRAEAVLGWVPERSGAEALIRSYDWYQEAGSSRPEGIAHRSRWREQALGVLRRFS